MRWSEKVKMWCVKPRHFTSQIEVVSWCVQRFGESRIDDNGVPCGQRYGTWAWGTGDYYGFNYTGGGAYEALPNRQLYFAFNDREDALVFVLTWSEFND